MRGDEPPHDPIYGRLDSFPRMRGDEPIAVPDDMVEQLFSPHARG